MLIFPLFLIFVFLLFYYLLVILFYYWPASGFTLDSPAPDAFSRLAFRPALKRSLSLRLPETVSLGLALGLDP